MGKEASPSAWASGTRGRVLIKNTGRLFPECGSAGTQGRDFLKKILPTGKRFKKNGHDAYSVKLSPGASTALGKGFLECSRFATRGRSLSHEKRPR